MNGTQSEPTFDRGGANVQELLASFPQGEPGDEEEEEEEEDYEIGAQEDRNGEDDGTEVYAISEGERSQPRHSLINSADFSSISNQQGQEAEPQMTTEESSASLTGTATGTGEKVSSSSDDRERAAEREGAREAMRVDTTSTELAIATLTSGKRINFSGAFLQAHVAAITHTRQAGPVLEALLVEPRMEEVRNTFWAYRVLDMETGQSFESSDDDGEPGAGEKVLLTMQRLCLDNLLLIVTQWDTGAQGRLGSRLFRQVVGVCKSLLSDLQKEIVGEGKGTRGSRGGKGRDGFPQRSGDGSGMLAVVAERTTFQDSYVLQTSAMEGGGMGSLSYMQGPDGGSLSLPKASMESEGAGVPLKFPGAGGRGVGTASNKALIHQAAVSVMHRDMTRELLNQRGGNALKKPEALSGPRKAPAPVRPHLLSRKANRGASPENVEGGRGRKKKRPPAKGQKGSGGGFGPKCQFTSFDFDEINEPMEIPPKFGAAQGSSALQGGPLGPNNFMSAAVAAQDPSRALNERTKRRSLPNLLADEGGLYDYKTFWEASEQILQSLTKKEILQLRAMQHPHKTIKTVVFCVGVLLGIVPPDSGSQSQWPACRSLVLSSPTLRMELLLLDLAAVTEAQIERVREEIKTSKLELVRRTSSICAVFLEWIRSAVFFWEHRLTRASRDRRDSFRPEGIAAPAAGGVREATKERIASAHCQLSQEEEERMAMLRQHISTEGGLRGAEGNPTSVLPEADGGLPQVIEGGASFAIDSGDPENPLEFAEEVSQRMGGRRGGTPPSSSGNARDPNESGPPPPSSADGLEGFAGGSPAGMENAVIDFQPPVAGRSHVRLLMARATSTRQRREKEEGENITGTADESFRQQGNAQVLPDAFQLESRKVLGPCVPLFLQQEEERERERQQQAAHAHAHGHHHHHHNRLRVTVENPNANLGGPLEFQEAGAGTLAELPPSPRTKLLQQRQQRQRGEDGGDASRLETAANRDTPSPPLRLAVEDHWVDSANCEEQPVETLRALTKHLADRRRQLEKNMEAIARAGGASLGNSV